MPVYPKLGLSVKQVLAAVVEILVKKCQFTLNPVPPKLKFGQDLALLVLTTPVPTPALSTDVWDKSSYTNPATQCFIIIDHNKLSQLDSEEASPSNLMRNAFR